MFNINYLAHLIVIGSYYASMVLLLNLLVGYTGLLSVAQAAIGAFGGYAVAVLGSKYGLSFIAILPICLMLGAFIGVSFGLILSRLKGDYFALATMGFNVIIFSLILNLESVTRGAYGISALKKPEILGYVVSGPVQWAIIFLLLLFIVYRVVYFLTSSSFGLVLKGVREDGFLVSFLGFKISKFKLTVFAIASALTCFVEGFYASYVSYISPSTYRVDQSILILSMVVMGGLASLRGSIIAGFIFALLPEILRNIGLPVQIADQSRVFIYGVVLVVLMIYRPLGIDGKYKL